MRIRPTGVSIPPGFGVTWEFAEGDKEVARRTIIFLENRRVLFGRRHIEDEMHCVLSAIEIRDRLTEWISSARAGGGLEQSLRAMRAAFTQFVNAAGPDAANFRWHGGGDSSFAQALGELRSLVGIQLALVVDKYDLDIEEDLASIFPPSDGDLTWLPGFEQD